MLYSNYNVSIAEINYLLAIYKVLFDVPYSILIYSYIKSEYCKNNIYFRNFEFYCDIILLI